MRDIQGRPRTEGDWGAGGTAQHVYGADQISYTVAVLFLRCESTVVWMATSSASQVWLYRGLGERPVTNVASSYPLTRQFTGFQRNQVMAMALHRQTGRMVCSRGLRRGTVTAAYIVLDGVNVEGEQRRFQWQGAASTGG